MSQPPRRPDRQTTDEYSKYLKDKTDRILADLFERSDERALRDDFERGDVVHLSPTSSAADAAGEPAAARPNNRGNSDLTEARGSASRLERQALPVELQNLQNWTLEDAERYCRGREVAEAAAASGSPSEAAATACLLRLRAARRRGKKVTFEKTSRGGNRASGLVPLAKSPTSLSVFPDKSPQLQGENASVLNSFTAQNVNIADAQGRRYNAVINGRLAYRRAARGQNISDFPKVLYGPRVERLTASNVKKLKPGTSIYYDKGSVIFRGPFTFVRTIRGPAIELTIKDIAYATIYKFVVSARELENLKLYYVASDTKIRPYKAKYQTRKTRNRVTSKRKSRRAAKKTRQKRKKPKRKRAQRRTRRRKRARK